MSNEELNAYFDRELSADAQQQFEERLRDDARARAEIDAIERLDRALETLPGAEPGDGFARRVAAAATASIGTRMGRGRLLRILVPLAAAAALVLVLLPTQRTDDSPETTVVFTADDYLDYVWEADEEVYEGFAPSESEYLRALGAT